MDETILLDVKKQLKEIANNNNKVSRKTIIIEDDIRKITNDDNLTVTINLTKIKKDCDELILETKNEEINKMQHLIKNDLRPINEDTFKESVNYISKLANDLFKEEAKDEIFNYLPITKTKRFNKTKNSILAIIPYEELKSNNFSRCKTWMLKTKFIDERNIEIIFTYDNYNITKSIVLLQNENNSIELSDIPKNLKTKDIKPGYIYEDIKGSKYLYLGKGMFYFYPVTCFTVEEIKNIPDEYRVSCHNYILINKKLENILENTLSYKDFLDKWLNSIKDKPNILCSSQPRTFVKEIKEAVCDIKEDRIYTNMKIGKEYYIVENKIDKEGA